MVRESYPEDPYFLENSTVYGPDRRVDWPSILPDFTVSACRGFSYILCVQNAEGRCIGYAIKP